MHDNMLILVHAKLTNKENKTNSRPLSYLAMIGSDKISYTTITHTWIQPLLPTQDIHMLDLNLTAKFHWEATILLERKGEHRQLPSLQ